MRLLIGTLLGALVIGAPSAVPLSPADWVVRVDRSGPIRVGMTLPQVRRALRDPHAFLEGNDPEVPLRDCAYLNSRILPKELGFMFSRGRVVRIDVFDRGIATDSGVEVGSTESDVRKSCVGPIEVETHHYDPGGHYLICSPQRTVRPRLQFLFETDGTHVTRFRVGTPAAIALVEGCS